MKSSPLLGALVNPYAMLVACRLCSELRLDKDRWGRELSRCGLESTILYSGSRVSVLLALGPLCIGHLLIVPHEHLPSTLTLDASDKEELLGIMRRVRETLVLQYGGCLLFEHGNPLGCARRISCVDHAHIHAVPVGVPVNSELRQYFEVEQCGLDELLRRAPPPRPYLFLVDIDGSCLYVEVEKIESQFMRKLVWNACIRAGDWDWRFNLGIPMMLRTQDQLRNLLGGKRR